MGDVRVGQRLIQQLMGQPQPQPPPVHQLVQQRMLSSLIMSSQSHSAILPPSPPSTSPPRPSPTLPVSHPTATAQSFSLILPPPDSVKSWPLKPAARRIAVTNQPASEPV